MQTDFIEQYRVQAPPLKSDFKDRHGRLERENWRLVERDLSEDPKLWPLPSLTEAFT